MINSFHLSLISVQVGSDIFAISQSIGVLVCVRVNGGGCGGEVMCVFNACANTYLSLLRILSAGLG